MLKNQSRLGILIVDNSPYDRAMIANVFSDEFLIYEAEDETGAMEQLSNLKDVSAVILNSHTHDSEDFGVLDFIKQNGMLKHIPVVVCADSNDLDYQRKALTHGAEDILIKPFDTMVAFHRVNNIILRCSASMQPPKSIWEDILYGAVDNITPQIRLLNQDTQISTQLTKIMGSVSGGILDFEITEGIKVVFFNDMTALMFGYNHEEYERLFCDSPMSAVHPDDLENISFKINTVMSEEGGMLETTYRHICKDGSWRWVRFVGRIVKRSKSITYASGILIDIDSLVQDEKNAIKQASELQKQRLFLKWLYDTLPCGIMQFTTKCGRFGFRELLGLNDMTWKIYGYSSRQQYMESVRGRSKFRNVHPDDFLVLHETIERVCAPGSNERQDCECRVFLPDGSIRWIRYVFQKTVYTDNEEVMQVIFTDITEQKHEDLKRLCDALFSVYDEVHEVNINDNTITLRASNHEDPSSIGKTIPFNTQIQLLCDRMVYPDDRKKFLEYYGSFKKCTEEMPISLEYRYIHSDGQECWASSTAIHVEGAVYLTCFRDITDQKKAEQLAQENKTLQLLVKERRAEDERNRIFIDSTGILVYDYDPWDDTLKVRRKNPDGMVVVEKTLGYVENIMENETISIGDRERIRDCFIEALKEPSQRIIEYRSNRFGNGFCLCRAQIVSIADIDGIVYRVIGQVSKVENEQQKRLLTEKLNKITGFDYMNIPYQHDMTEDVLKIIESGSDTDVAVQTVLEVVGRQLDVSRVYIIEEKGDGIHCSNTFEWCSEGTAPQINNLHNYTYPEGMRDMYIGMFKDEGVLSCSDISTLPEWLRGILELQDIKSIVQCAIMKNGVFHGFVGFDECRENRQWTATQIHTLKIISQVIGSFLFGDGIKQMDESSEEILKAMNSSPAYIYVINPDTGKVLYSNEAVNNVGGVVTELECYKTIMNRGAVCTCCPVEKLKELGVSIPMEVSVGGRRFIMQASWNNWHGEKAVIVSGTDARSFYQDSEEKRRIEYERDLNRYTSTLFSLFDEILEIDFYHNTFKVLLSRNSRLSQSLKQNDFKESWVMWINKYVYKDDRKTLKDFLDINIITKEFAKGISPVIEYRLNIDGGSNRWNSCTLLQMDGGRYLCCNKDITNQKKAIELEKEVLVLQAKAEEQDRYRIVTDQTRAAVIEINHITGAVYFSEAYKRYETSRHGEERLTAGDGNYSLVYPDDYHVLDEFIKAREEGASCKEVVLRVKMTNGSFRWTKMAGTFIHDSKGNLIRTIGTLTDVDEEVRAKLQLEEVSHRLSMIIDNIPTGVAIYEIRDKLYPIFLSNKACEMFGFTREEYDLCIANKQDVYFIPDLAESLLDGINNINDEKQYVIKKLHAQKKDGSWFYLRMACRLDRKNVAYPICYAVLSDITEEVEKEKREAWQAERYRILSESEKVITFDYSPKEDMMCVSLTIPGKGFTEEVMRQYQATFNEYGRVAPASKESFIAALRSASSATGEGSFDFQADYYGDGFRWYRARYVSIADEEGEIYRVVGRVDDINDIIISQDLIREKAQLDGVTGIRNKDYARSIIETALKEKPVDRFDAMLFMDVDEFKKVNDTIGHFDADKVLRKIGMILTDIFRREDVVARFGGDEFIVYMQSAGGIKHVEKKASQIIEQVSSIQVRSDVPIRCSIGIVGVIGDNTSFEEVFRKADTALYDAKRNGRNQYAISKNVPEEDTASKPTS